MCVCWVNTSARKHNSPAAAAHSNEGHDADWSGSAAPGTHTASSRSSHGTVVRAVPAVCEERQCESGWAVPHSFS